MSDRSSKKILRESLSDPMDDITEGSDQLMEKVSVLSFVFSTSQVKSGNPFSGSMAVTSWI